MAGFGPGGHTRKHDIASTIDHKGDIFDALVNAVNALTAANVAVDTKTLNDAISAAIVGMHWQPPIIRFEAMVTNEPVAPSDGDRYISTEAGAIPSTSQAVLVGDVCEWDTGSSLWIVTTPEDGWAVIEQGVDPNIAWWFNGTIWRKLGTIVDHSNLLNLDWSVAQHVMDTDLDMDSNQINQLADPTLDDDADTKGARASAILKAFQFFSYQSPVIAISSSAPIGAPGGARYLVAHVVIVGDPWIGHEDDIAISDGVGGWSYITTQKGWLVYDETLNQFYVRTDGFAQPWDNLSVAISMSHSATTGQTENDHHVALEVYNPADTKQTASKKLVQHSFAYTNGGNTINLASFTNALVRPRITFGIELNGLAYDNRIQVTPLITSLTHNGTYWVAVVRCNKTYYQAVPPGIVFVECATNDVDITIMAGGE